MIKIAASHINGIQTAEDRRSVNQCKFCGGHIYWGPDRKPYNMAGDDRHKCEAGLKAYKTKSKKRGKYICYACPDCGAKVDPLKSSEYEEKE